MTIGTPSTVSRHARVLAATLLLATGPASATLKNVEQAYELGLNQVALPASDNGSLVIRVCATCKPTTLRVNPGTRYILRPAVTPVTRAEFAAGVAKITSRAAASVFVYVEPGTGKVRRVVLQPGR
jgi:hypothetical protein